MIEFITTPKTAILFTIISTIIVSIVLTGFVTLAGLPFISALAFCAPLSLVTVVGIMLVGGVIFHAHRKITK